MSTALLARIVRPGLAAAVVLGALGIPNPARAAAVETETVSRTAAFTPGATLTVRNFSGHVTITGTDRADVSVQAVRRATRERLDRIKLEVRTAEGGGVVIEDHDEIPAARLASAAGTVGYLRKPFDIAALIALVRPWLWQNAPERAAG